MSDAKDVILITVLLFMLGLGFFVVNFTAKTMTQAFVAIPMINQTEAAKQAFNDTATVSDRFDYLMLGVFVGMLLAFIIGGYYVAGEPIFMFAYFVITIIGVIISMLLSNTWYDMTNATAFGTTIASFPITDFILSHLPYYTAILGFIGIVVMFARPYIESRI